MKSISVSVVAYGGRDFRHFDYLPKKDTILPIGSIIKVPFGKQKSLGVVLHTTTEPTSAADLLPIEKILEVPPIPNHLLDLASWLSDYYAASPKAVWRTILPSGLEQRSQLKKLKTSANTGHKPITLNLGQQKAIATILSGEHRGYLLHGITGSGKTEIYIRIITENLRRGKSAILLVPEISLTPQMIERLNLHFPEQLLVNHSKLTPARRKQVWLQAAQSERPIVVIGPRSSLFLPLHSIGVIIVDEEHEQSYKQENTPCYNTNQVVAKICELTKSHYVLGSATPSINTYLMAKENNIGYIQLTERAGEGKLPKVTILDKRDRHELLLPELTQAMRRTLQRGDQVLLFINRRGSAGAMMCGHCGETIRCPNCDMSLTFHGDIARLVCHYCGFKRLPPHACPSCNEVQLSFVGSGTKGVEVEIEKAFSRYRIARLDSDNGDIETIQTTYKQLQDRQIDIIVGTQMIARGLDLAGIGLVGVIATDSMLAIPDYSSSERTFQLLTQVAGRAGRSNNTGEVIIQTLSPTHPAIIAASHHDFEAFFEHEIQLRQRYAYPPYRYLVKLMYGHKNEQKATSHSTEIAHAIALKWPGVQVLGPTDRAIRRSGGLYWKQLIVKSKRRATLLDIIRDLKPGWKHDIDPTNMS